jgi:hypothetical protein
MNISMDLHQKILAASRETVLQEAADACNNERKEAVRHQWPIMALGALACRRQVEALGATPAPVSPAVRISEIEAAQAHNQKLNAGIFSGQVREQHLEVRIAELEAALLAILEIPNSEAAQGVMKVFAHEALKAKP